MDNRIDLESEQVELSTDQHDNENMKELSQNKDLSLKLTWDQVTYSVKAKQTNREKKSLCSKTEYYSKELIKNASGYCNVGETLFIMGSSGAGKTTMLNILSDRVLKSSTCKLEGDIMINDSYPVNNKDFGAYAGYVTQDDYLFSSFTWEQAITFAAKLRLNLSSDQVQERIDEIIDSLGLIKCRKTMIGNERIKGLSGGERKRTAIAVEMITDPTILFLDEPTSGLDSFTAKKIVELLVNYSQQGKMIIATIHQPSSETFKLFGRLLLLMDGYTIYQGEALKSVEYFKELGFVISEFSNPADYYLKEFYIPDVKGQTDIDKMEKLVETYKKSLAPMVKQKSENIQYSEINKATINSYMVKTNWFYEFWILIQRTIINQLFHPEILKFKGVATIVMSLICLSVFYKLDNSEEGLRSKVGSSFFMWWFCTYFPVGNTLMAFTDERPVFLREYSNKTYGLMSYALSKSLIEIPFETLSPLIFSTIVYFGLGFNNSFENFIIFTWALILNTSCATSVGLAIGSGIANPNTANNAMPAFVAPMVLFWGAAVNLSTVYVWLSWLQYLSPIRYTLEIITRNEFEGTNFESYTIDRLNYDIGIVGCFMALLGLTLGFRTLAIIFLRLTIKTV